MIALVNPKVQALRKPLEKFGFRVIEYEFPLKSSDIQGEELRKTIDKSGCCGMSEFGKLGAWKLTQYKKVLALICHSKVFTKSLNVHCFSQNSYYFLMIFTHCGS